MEIRLLGPLRIQRLDGTVVDARALRTGKTADLLRILATRPDLGISVDCALNELWPHAERVRGLASLRTAVSQIRTVLGQECLVRRGDQLQLGPAWVDTVELRGLAARQRTCRKRQDWQSVVEIGRAAAELYLADLSSYDSSGQFLGEERAFLRRTQRDLLLATAQAAVELGWYTEGTEYAERALLLDPFCEQACRALMRSHAGNGETGAALRAYQDCRVALRDELGTDPSSQTHAVYLQVLTATPGGHGRAPGHAHESPTHRLITAAAS